MRDHFSLHRPEFFRSTPPLTLGKTLSYCVTSKRERFTRAVYHECKGKQTLLITQNCVGMVILQGFKLYDQEPYLVTYNKQNITNYITSEDVQK